MRRSLLVEHRVAYELPAPGQQLLERRLEIDRVLERILDLGPEGLDHRRGRLLVAVGQVAGADHRLDHRGQHALGAHQRLDPGGRADAAPAPAAGRGPPAARPPPGTSARDRLGADLGQAARAEAVGLEAREQVGGHGQPQHAVAEEGQPLVGLRPPRRPRGMGEHRPRQVGRQLIQSSSCSRLGGGPGRRGCGPVRLRLRRRAHSASAPWFAAAWERDADGAAAVDATPLASTKSTACPTVRIRAASSSEMLHAVGVLELLDQRVQIERVGLRVLTKPRGLLNGLGLDLELVHQVGADQREDLFASHRPHTVARALGRAPGGADQSSLLSAPTGRGAAQRPGRLQRPPGGRRSRPPRPRGPPPRSPGRSPRRVKRPWATTPSWRSPSM